MRKDTYETQVDIFPADGKELYRALDGLRACRVTCPLADEVNWVEIDIDAEMPNEYEAALAEVIGALR